MNGQAEPPARRPEEPWQGSDPNRGRRGSVRAGRVPQRCQSWSSPAVPSGH